MNFNRKNIDNPLSAKELYDLKSHVGEVRGRLNSLSQRKS